MIDEKKFPFLNDHIASDGNDLQRASTDTVLNVLWP